VFFSYLTNKRRTL